MCIFDRVAQFCISVSLQGHFQFNLLHSRLRIFDTPSSLKKDNREQGFLVIPNTEISSLPHNLHSLNVYDKDLYMIFLRFCIWSHSKILDTCTAR